MAYPEINGEFDESTTYKSFGTNKGKPYENFIQDLGGRSTVRHRSAITNGDRHTPTAFWHDRTKCFGAWDQHRTTAYYTSIVNFDDRYTKGPSCNPGFKATNYVNVPGYAASSRPSVRLVLKENECANRILDQINAQAFNAGAFLVELPETVSSVASAAKTLVSVALSVKKGRYSRALRQIGLSRRQWNKSKLAFKSASERWLAVKFGVLPLVSDISDLTELHRNAPALEKVFRLSARTSLSNNGTIDEPVNSVISREGKWYGTSYMKVEYAITDPHTIAQKALGLANPPAALWEGVPFSWLLDYVVGVGDYLERLGATQGLSFAHGYKAQKILGSMYLKKNQMVTYSNGTFLHDNSWSKALFEGYRRWPITSFPSPTIEWSLDDITLSQVSNVIALIGVLMKTKT